MLISLTTKEGKTMNAKVQLGNLSPAKPEIECLHDSIGGISDNANNALLEINAFFDRFFGTRPESPDKEGPVPVSSGKIGTVQDSIRHLRHVVSKLNDAAGRLHTIA